MKQNLYNNHFLRLNLSLFLKLLILTLFTGINFVIAKPAVISGNVKGSKYDYMVAMYYKNYPDFIISNYTFDTVKINSDGGFKIEINLDHPIEFHLKNGQYWAASNAYIAPGMDLKLQIEYQQSRRTIDYEGSAAFYNKFLIDFTEKYYKDIEEFNIYHNSFTKPLNEFITYIDSRKKSQWDYYREYFKSMPADKDFDEYMKAEINWKWATDRVQYLFKQKQFNDKNKIPTPDPSYFSFLNELDLNNTKPYSNLRYPHFVNQYIYLLNQLKTEELLEAKMLPEPSVLFNNYLNIAADILKGESFDIAIGLQLMDLINSALTFLPESAAELRAYNRDDKILIEGYLSEFEKRVTFRDYYNNIKEKFDESLLITAGQMAPVITLPDFEGKMVSFSDFKGKMVFLDFWATWCAPCLNEMPKSIELQNKYKDKDVVFIYISIDSDLQKAKDYVKSQNIGGVHLFDSEGLKSDIARKYMIKTIPRYVLIDKDGKLITVNAPSPSQNIGYIIDEFLKLDKTAAPAEQIVSPETEKNNKSE